MKATVTLNIDTDLDATNGSHGTIADIVLHLNKPRQDERDLAIRLTHVPLYIPVKLN